MRGDRGTTTATACRVSIDCGSAEIAMPMWNLALTLLLLVTANASPIVARGVLGKRLAYPLDLGHCLADGRRLFGDSKTLRGLLTATLATAAVAAIAGLDWRTGASVGVLAMAGDLLSSFIKRRRGLPSGARAPGLDHVPESLLPLLVVGPSLGLDWVAIIALVLAFTAVDIGASRLLYRFGIGQHPH